MQTKPKILLAEDDISLAFVIKDNLSDRGYDITHCSNGLEAERIIYKEKFDLYLLDVMMPGLDGKATFGKFKEIPSLAAIPVVFMTAKVLTHEIDFYLELGAAGVISKPFDPMTLAEEVQTIWAHSRV